MLPPFYIQGPYCTTKAALHMMYKCMSPELLQQDVLLGSIDPGVVDTPMQGDIEDSMDQKTNFLHTMCFLICIQVASCRNQMM